ncbi:cytochrome c oxidase assembly protein CtaG/Cox11 [Pavlovales sp. CCMP2436]|nr:cytochrome c oxidase assembly protein CtaG/Cox11 [Pavlovales sp. CCMP2436]
MAVPVYRMFCQATGYGGTVKGGAEASSYAHLPADPGTLERNRLIKITFNTDMAANLPWKFKPTQPQVTLRAGETALCFFRATNITSEPIVGVATYNITPMRAGQYFNKVQCFCFDQQRLLPNETVDMPVFFYIDPDFLDDPNMAGINTLTLSYTFFRADRETHRLPAYLQEMEPGAKLHNPVPAPA